MSGLNCGDCQTQVAEWVGGGICKQGASFVLLVGGVFVGSASACQSIALGTSHKSVQDAKAAASLLRKAADTAKDDILASVWGVGRVLNCARLCDLRKVLFSLTL